MPWLSTLAAPVGATDSRLELTAPMSAQRGSNYAILDAGASLEIVRVTGIGTSALFVERGVMGTEAVPHDAGAAVSRYIAPTAAAVGGHPDFATHAALGLAPAADVAGHLAAADPHVAYALDADLANHETDGHVHNHDAAYAHTHPYAATVHGHAESEITNLTADLAGKAATVHNHDAAYAPTHAHPYAATSHAHVDGDLPAGLARDAEVTSAIATHAGTPHGGSLPAGLIVMWGGLVANIPAGWVLCNGANGTPDLRDRFVKGATAEPGTTGGASTHTHAAHTGVINHTHPVTDPGHVHVENSNNATTGGLRGWGAADTSTSTPTATGYSTASGTTGVTTTNPAGGVASLTHDSPSSEPPFYALAFIQKL